MSERPRQPAPDAGQPEGVHRRVRQVLDALFADADGTDDEPEATKAPDNVFDHLSECDACRRYFNRLAYVDRQLTEGAPDDGTDPLETPSEFEHRLSDLAFGAALDDLAAEETSDTSDSDTSGEDDASVISAADRFLGLSSGDITYAATAAAIIAVTALAAFLADDMMRSPNELPPPSNSASSDEFRARSAARPPSAGTFNRPTLKVFCVHRQGGDVRFESGDGETLACPRHAELKLAYRNPDRRLQYAAFFGVDAKGNMYWYGPTPADETPVSIESRPVTTPIGETIRLRVNHEPGRVRVFGFFSTRPVDFDRLQRAVGDGGVSFGQERLTFDELPGTSTSRVFEVVEGT